MIFITGDTHIPIDIKKLNSKNFPAQHSLTKKDYLIICGDFGGVWNGLAEERYWLKWLDERSFTTLFVDGNHENFDLLNKYPVENCYGGKVHVIRPSVFHLMRGQVYNIDGLKLFCMGGAESHDRTYRIEGKSWWSTEMPSKNEYREALENLNKNEWTVDVVITHCAPSSIQNEICYWYKRNDITNFFEVIKKDLTFKEWYFGHYHIDKEIKNFNALYDSIKLIEGVKNERK